MKLAKFYKLFFCFYLLIWGYILFILYTHGAFLSQLKPIFLIQSLDIIQNILIQNGLLEIIQKYGYFIDLIFVSVPLVMIMCTLWFQSEILRKAMCIFVSLFLFGYGLIIDATTMIHYEGFIMMGVFSLLFYSKNDQNFYFSFHSYRYLFLFIFFSAGIWKLRTGSVCHPDQMSAILLHQHAILLSKMGTDFYAKFICFLISNSYFSFGIYIIATLIELVFVIGFFSLKHDKILFVLFLGFIIFDKILMQIDYLPWLGYAFTLLYSEKIKYTYATNEFNSRILH